MSAVKTSWIVLCSCGKTERLVIRDGETTAQPADPNSQWKYADGRGWTCGNPNHRQNFSATIREE